MAKKILLQADYILTWDKGLKIINQGEIVIEDSIVTYLGPRQERPGEVFERVLKKKDNLIMPGFINTHTHAAMSLFRGYADDLPLKVWLNDKIWPVEAKLKKKDIYWGTLLAITEMLRGGTTCFADMYFHMGEVAKACYESGIRASLSQGLAGLGKIKGMSGLKEGEDLVRNWHLQGDGRITVMLGPHAIYTCPPDYLQKVMKKAADLDVPIHIHLAETRDEVKECLDKYGKTPVNLLEEIGLLDYRVLAAHCVHLTSEEIETLVEKRTAIAHNPGSNLKLGSGIAPVVELLKKEALVSLGTDSAASNNNLDMVEEMRLAALLPKGLLENPTAVPVEEALKMATSNGAEALFLDKKIGKLSEGSKADLIMFNLHRPHFYPRHNLLAHLVYSARASDINMVMVNGKILMLDGQLITIDEERVLFEAQLRATKLVS